MAEPQINLGQFVGRDHRYELSINNETPEDALARRQSAAADAALTRHMRFLLFLFALAMTAVVFSGAVYVLGTGSANDKTWAAGIVSAIASGLVGFLVGQGKR